MGRHILVVDDNQGILDAFEAVLEGTGYDVKTSIDGGYLMNLTPDQFPDLIVLDVLLSGADGRDICKKLKTQDNTKNIPIIMVSAHPGAKQSVEEACADDFIAKPFEIEELLEKIKKHLHL